LLLDAGEANAKLEAVFAGSVLSIVAPGGLRGALKLYAPSVSIDEVTVNGESVDAARDGD
jgi:hypothetical protein